MQLTGQRERLHNQVTETLDCIKEAMEKREVTQSLEALKTQHELLMTAERRMQEAKRRTKELLNNNFNSWEVLRLDEHRKCVQFKGGAPASEVWRRHGRQDLLGWSRDAKQEERLEAAVAQCQAAGGLNIS